MSDADGGWPSSPPDEPPTGDAGAGGTGGDRSSPDLPAAGWYADPEGRGLRWWDGHGWTEHRSTDAASQPDGLAGRQLATFGQRVGAFLLDTLVVLVMILVPLVLVVVVAAVLFGTLGDSPAAEPFLIIGGLVGYLGFFLVILVAPLAYRAELQWRRHGATIGKALVGIEVIDRRTGGRLTRGKAWGRAAFNSLVSAQICYLGYLWMLFDDEKRTWHDMVLDSHVVRREGPAPSIRRLLER